MNKLKPVDQLCHLNITFTRISGELWAVRAVLEQSVPGNLLSLPGYFVMPRLCCRYSYAIVGINLTEMAYSLLKNGALKGHLYNVVCGLPQLEHFHQFYCESLQLLQGSLEFISNFFLISQSKLFVSCIGNCLLLPKLCAAEMYI